MLRLSLTTGTEGGDVAVLTQAQLIAACAGGALKSFFTAPLFQPPPGPGEAAWANLHEDARLTVAMTPFNTDTSGAFLFSVISTVNSLTLTMYAAGTLIVELRFWPTNNR